MAGLDTTVLQRTFDAIDTLATLQTPSAILAETAKTFAAFGYSAFVLTRLPRRTGNIEPYMLLNAWPGGWSERYLEAGHYRYDPVARHCMESERAFSWTEIPDPLFEDGRARAIPNEAAAFGLKSGLCVPLHTPLGAGGMSLAGEQVDDTPSVRAMARLLSFYVCAAVERVAYGVTGGARLTPREQDVLSWVAAGKSAPEIAEQLNISAFTVGDHLKHIRAKLGTRNNAHSVAVALQTGQVKL
jgi:LuxR family transcriptional regulator, quorum-sensing system regulator BjaR1